MAYIAPKFTNFIDAPSMVNMAMKDRELDEQANRANFDRMLTGIASLGKGIGKARQWYTAEKYKKDLMDKLEALKNARAQASSDLDSLNAERDEAKGTVVGINNMLPEPIVGGPYPFSNEITPIEERLIRDLKDWESKPNDPLMHGVDYNWQAYGRKSGLI